MSNITKKALEASLKKLMMKKPLDKITIRDITDDCGISRMTFYYHFQDIYDLIEWVCVEDARAALQGKKTCATWNEGLEQIFEAVLDNKTFILNAYRCISREQMENLQVQLCGGDAGLDPARDARRPPGAGPQRRADHAGQHRQRHPQFSGEIKTFTNRAR